METVNTALKTLRLWLNAGQSMECNQALSIAPCSKDARLMGCGEPEFQEGACGGWEPSEALWSFLALLRGGRATRVSVGGRNAGKS